MQLIILISLVGWFGVQNSILANGILHALNFKINFFVAAFFSGFFLTFLVASGFIALSYTAKISVPLFFLVVGYILLTMSLKDSSIEHNSEVINISLSQGATIVAGGFIAAALTTPDISRYCKSNRDVFWMITLSIIIGEFFINAIAIFIAQSLNTADVVTIMTHSAGWIGLISVILSVIKVNDVNLYSSSLGLANSLEVLSGRQFSYYKLTFILGSIGTLLSMLGILNHFVDFLVMLGVLFPPVTGIMLVDYYILRTHRKLLDFTRSHGTLPDAASTPKIGWNAILAWIVGSFVGFTIHLGIPSLNSLFAASAFYWITCTIGNRFFIK
ncbi:cytosine permease [Sodalis endosymbiont of Spalangia cameroni]|uniref:cytosine permease n=1 Tax=Sodalis praecaptivus TaxID=1239307 RepID=UPI0031F7886A